METLTPADVYTILRVEVGSTAHGTGLPDVEDRDEMALAVPPPSLLFGVRPWDGTIVWRPGRGPGDRSGPGDLDLTVYSLQKWCKLAAAGNPSILLALWAPVLETCVWGDALRRLAPMFVARSVAKPFLGYAKAQREKLIGVRGGRHTNRPKLVEMYGYDTKYAMHMIRLGLQGRELLQTGQIGFPATERDLLLDIRHGKVGLGDVLGFAEANEAVLLELADRSDLPPFPDVPTINQFLSAVYLDVYARDTFAPTL